MVDYPALIERHEDGEWIVTFPNFSWGATSGGSESDAILMGEDCLALMLADMEAEGEAIPSPDFTVRHTHNIRPQFHPRTE